MTLKSGAIANKLYSGKFMQNLIFTHLIHVPCFGKVIHTCIQTHLDSQNTFSVTKTCTMRQDA